MIQLRLQTVFSSAHFYSQQKWNESSNLETFGKCYSRFGHGHNYRLEVEFTGEQSLLEKNQLILQRWLQQLGDRLDHRHLNHEISEFKTTIPTTENIALWFWNQIQENPPQLQVTRLRLFELDDLWVEVKP